MRRMLPFVPILLLPLLASSALAGRVSPGLERMMAGMKGDDEIRVIVVMQDQAPVTSLDRNLHVGMASRAERHKVVVDALRSTAARSQASLLGELEARKAAGPVREFEAYWIVNAMKVVTTVDHARQLALRADVAAVEPDLPVELIEPVNAHADKKAPGGNSVTAIGIAPGIVAVGARRVWTELGINGAGALVANMDTGVDGAHPALSARWRGNFAPAAECWRDAVGFGDATPVDRHYHGTHTMGTICGLAPNDSIGVAPGALWIADNTINQGTGSAFDSDVVSGFQWFADPDGNSSTTDDVPDVVQNSWGVNEGFSGYVDCDTRWWAAVDNCEAAGVVVTWSAGNEGPGSGTLRSPADRATTPYNTFSVGATEYFSPYTIAGFSSRGPSGCGGVYAMKPEISAPGVNIYSAQPGGGYQNLDGTSMAGPHVAGVVALMRAANPDVDVTTVKQILMDTAVDLGTAGEDNTYGHGFVSAYDAVLAVLSGYGRLEGTVTDAVTHLPIAGAVVDVLSDPRGTTTNASGFFSIPLPAGSWTLEYSAFGHVTHAQAYDVIADQVTDASYAMAQSPQAIVSGTVRDYTSALVNGASITVLGTPLAPVLSQPDGTYSISVPDGATYQIRARKDGFGADVHSVVVAGATVQDFTLPELTYEDFESGDFQLWPWVMSGTAPWTIDTGTVHEGSYAARSGVIGDSQSSTMALQLSITQPGNVTFWYTVSSEATYDYLRFYVDGVQMAAWSGTVPWAQASYPVTQGTHTFTWTYSKDGSVASGSDAAWVDLIDFPNIGAPQYPDVAASPSPVTHASAPDQIGQELLTVANVGTATLDYSVTLVAGPVAQAGPRTVPADGELALDHELAKGEPDPRTGTPPLTGSGGPDTFGYTWIDSDESGGPAYSWVEISGVGTPLTMGDDTYTASLPMGITFPFYGNNYTTVHVSSNGFVSFTAATGSWYSNGSVPSATDPDDLVCAYWDDLNPNDGGTIYTYQDVANQRFVVQWNAVPRYGTSGTQPQTFEIILNADGSVVTQYKTVTNVTSATVGIENATGSDGLQVVFNAAYLHDSLAVRFSTAPAVPWLAVAPTGGSVPAGDADVLTCTFDATGLVAGVYQAVVRLNTNDPDEAVVNVPVTLTVSDATDAPSIAALPTRFELGSPRPNPFGAANSVQYAVPEGGERVNLSVFDVSGRRVRTLVNATMAAGRYVATWDGRDSAGRRVTSGVYFYRMDAGSFSDVRKVTLLK